MDPRPHDHDGKPLSTTTSVLGGLLRALVAAAAGLALGSAVGLGASAAPVLLDGQLRYHLQRHLPDAPCEPGTAEDPWGPAELRPTEPRWCVGVPTADHGPGLLRPEEVHGVWLPADLVPDSIVRDPRGRTLALPALADQPVDERRLAP